VIWEQPGKAVLLLCPNSLERLFYFSVRTAWKGCSTSLSEQPGKAVLLLCPNSLERPFYFSV